METIHNKISLSNPEVDSRKVPQPFTFLTPDEQPEENDGVREQAVAQKEKNNPVMIYNKPIFKVPKYNVLL